MTRIWWLVRAAVALCFVGHGMFGIMTKEEWVPLFGVAGLSRDAAFALMPLIGTVDVVLGLLVLFRPMRALFLYMAVWTVWTAALRPLSGSSLFELLERAGNYGLPLLALVLAGPALRWRDWFARLEAPSLTGQHEALAWRILTATTALLLIGHGGLAIAQKEVLVGHAALMGFGAESLGIIGSFELALAVLVVVAPSPALLVGVALGKVATELLYVVGGAPIWEFIERAGSYAAPLGLAILASNRALQRSRVGPRTAGLSSALVALLLVAWPAAAQAQGNGDAIPIAPAGILDSLRRGGYVIACRHTETDHNQSDRGPTRELQRNLTLTGVKQAKSIGAAIRALRIPIGEVRSNPMYRNQETATYAFGTMVVDSALVRGSSLRALLVASVPAGTNRAVVARIGTLSDALQDHGVETIQEGDCFVVRPMERRDYRILGRVRVEDWRRLASR
jgi:hypothetical protein